MRLTTRQFIVSKLNQIQRQGLFVSFAVAAVVLLLHFPFEGYTVQHEVITRYGTGQCPRFGSVEELSNLTREQSNLAFEQNRLCNNESELQLKPFQEWTSDSPIIPWFGSLVHALVALLFVVSLGGVWLWVFRDTHKVES